MEFFYGNGIHYGTSVIFRHVSLHQNIHIYSYLEWFMSACMHTYITCIHKYIHRDSCMSAYIYTYSHMSVCVHTYTHTHTCMNAYKYIISVNPCIYTYICIYACRYEWVFIIPIIQYYHLQSQRESEVYWPVLTSWHEMPELWLQEQL